MKLSFSAEVMRRFARGGRLAGGEPVRRVRADPPRGGPGDEHSYVQERKAWERKLHDGAAGPGWLAGAGIRRRGATIEQQVIFNEEYARAGGSGRMGHIGETLTGPTLIAFGTEQQKQRFCPASCGARICGARATPSPAPVRTWPT